MLGMTGQTMERAWLADVIHPWATESTLDIHPLMDNTYSHQAEHPQNTESKTPGHPNPRVNTLLQLNPWTLSPWRKISFGRTTVCQRQPEKSPTNADFPDTFVHPEQFGSSSGRHSEALCTSCVLRRGHQIVGRVFLCCEQAIGASGRAWMCG